MAPLTRSKHYKLPELPLEDRRVEIKDTQACSNPTVHAKSEPTRLVTYKSKSGTCPSCSKTCTQACADCCGMVFYCNADCQTTHWPEHKGVCQDLRDQHLNEVMEARDEKALIQITEDLGKIISSDFTSLNYKDDPKLSVKIDDSVSFGDFYDVLESSACTLRSFHPGTYKCTSVTPDKNCTPVTIYHHELVDPVKVMKQCILMSKDLFEHNDVPNQITMPEWCNWESADEEYIPSDSESEASDSEASESDLIFANFIGRVFDNKPAMESDLEDQEYDPSESDYDESSDESDVSDHEVDYLLSESKQYIMDIPQKRQGIAPTADMEGVEDGDLGAKDVDAGEDSDAEAYKDFKEKLLESEHTPASEIDDSDYLPCSDSDSDSGESVPERDMSDSEKCISDTEVKIMLESSEDMKDVNEKLYNEFVDNLLDRNHIEDDAEDQDQDQDQDYIPADSDGASSSEEGEINDSEEKALLEEGKDLIKNLSGKRLPVQTEFSSSESESDSDSEVSSEGELYEDFKIHTEAKSDMSDTEDVEYIPEHPESEASSSSSEGEMEISDAESFDLVDDSKDVKQVSEQKRICGPSQHEDCQDNDNEAEMESDDELYNDFRSKLIVTDPSKVDLGGSDDEDFVPPAESQESQDESQESQDEAQDEEPQGSDKSDEEMDVSDTEIKDLELSSDEELYEEFKDEVCKTQRKVQAQIKPNLNLPSENKELIYFMNSSYASSLKESLISDKIEKGTEIAGSIVLKNGAESAGIAVEMKGQNWRSAHIFEDTTSGKCFALVISTDTWEHLSNNHEHLEAHYPDQKWSSVAETNLKFQMKDFVH